MRRSGSGFSTLLLIGFIGTFATLVASGGAPSLADDDAPANAPHATPDATVRVTATRLDDGGIARSDLPAHVTVLDRAAIEASGARTVQDLLSEVSGINLYDQVGNDVQKTVDLRGFTGGKGIAVFVDGARVNDPRNNAVALEQIPLDAIDRIEITRGSAAALAGGGSEAGVVRIVTRRGTKRSASLSAGAGSFGAGRYDGTFGRRFGRFDLFASGSYDASDGFRHNAGGRQTRWDVTGGADLGRGRQLSLAVLSSDLDYGNPGALSLAEFEADPYQNVYNVLDATRTRARQASLSYRGPAGTGVTLAANLSYRNEMSGILSTGRSAAVYGGFFLDSDARTWSGTVQGSHERTTAHGANRVSFGVELLDGSTGTKGYFTDPASPGRYDPAAPSSRNTAAARNAALFVQDTWTVSPRWVLTAGARTDRDRVSYDEAVPDPSLRAARTFSETSLRGGATFRPVDRVEVYASYADSFLPPTPEQLFAFPFFGSNPDLAPEDARTWEAGARFRPGGATIETSVFVIDTANEIVFDPSPTPTEPFGRNVNGGATRRRGAELAARGRLAKRVSAFADLTWIDATFSGGPNAGDRIPLVPAVRASAGLDAALPRGFGLRADALHAGDQVLDNDAANARPKLPAYTVCNLTLRWDRSRGPRFGVFFEVRNLFDAVYATRGIYAFDAVASANATFVTPAPGRRYLAGIRWRM